MNTTKQTIDPYHEALETVKQLEQHIDKLQRQIDQAKESITQVVTRAMEYDPFEMVYPQDDPHVAPIRPEFLQEAMGIGSKEARELSATLISKYGRMAEDQPGNVEREARLRELSESRKGLLWELYWKHRDYVPGTQIASILGVKPNQVRTIIGEAVLIVPCRDCGKDLKLALTSRAHLKQTIGAYNGGKNTYDKVRCDECEAKQEAIRQAESEAWRESDRRRQARRDELHTMPYAEYLQTPEWEETRQRMLKRARYQCSLCNKKAKLHVHHRTYERRGYEDDKDLIVLCENCHAKFHDKLAEAE